MNWFFLTLLSVLGISITNIIRKVLMRGDKSNPYSYAVVFHMLLGVMNLCLAFIFHSNFSLADGNIFFIFIASFLWGGTTIFLFKAYQSLEASEVTILSSLKVFVTIFASIFLLKETFNLSKIVGTLCIIISTVLVVNAKKNFQVNKGLLYTLLMVLFSGLAIVADSFNVKHVDVVVYNTIVNFLIGFVLFVLYPQAIRQWEHFLEPQFFTNMLLLAFFSTAQAIASLLALTTKGVTAQVGTITQSATIVTILLAMIFLHEKNNKLRKLLAGLLVTIGVLFLS